MDIESQLLEEPASRLEKPVELNDLIEKCSEFTIRSMDEEEIERAEEMDVTQVYSMEELEPYCLTDALEPASDDEDDPHYDEITKSFPVFRKKMKNVTDDGKVMKLIDQVSYDEKVPSEGKIVVYYHYAAYVELTENPFDCSRLRQKRPESKTLGVGEVIQGLEIALRSMRRGEKAKFLVHPDLAFKEKGVPPRIPPQATILFDVELIDICADAKQDDFRAKDRTFDECLELAQKMRIRGNKLKTIEKNINGAISAYKKGQQILIESSFDNDEDEIKRRKEILHCYANLAVCYLEKKNYKMVCNMYNNACIDGYPDGEKNVKLLYCSGKALRMLGDFEQSLNRLRRAARLKPADESIVMELEKTANARRNYQNDETRACLRMFGFMNVNDDAERTIKDDSLLRTVGSEFKDIIEKTLDYLESSNRRNETLNASSYTYAEKLYIKKICAERNFLIRTPNESKILIIKKSV